MAELALAAGQGPPPEGEHQSQDHGIVVQGNAGELFDLVDAIPHGVDVDAEKAGGPGDALKRGQEAVTFYPAGRAPTGFGKKVVFSPKAR